LFLISGAFFFAKTKVCVMNSKVRVIKYAVDSTKSTLQRLFYRRKRFPIRTENKDAAFGGLPAP